MCGRFTLRTPIKDVADLFDLMPDAIERISVPPARFNIAPTQEIAAVRQNEMSHGREFAWLYWGLVPSWAEDLSIGNRLINARAETIATKRAFRHAFRHHRCLIPADGFFEWQRKQGRKQPYYIRLKDERPFAFAGLWERWEKTDVAIDSGTIITTDSNELIRPLHDRMPVIVDREHFDVWLDPAIEDPQILQPLLRSYPAQKMTAYPVSVLVNSPRHDTRECIEGAKPDKQTLLFE